MTKMFITKYALSDEIQGREGRITDDGVYFLAKGSEYNFHRIGRDVFATREEAVADAEKRRAKKVKALEKQLALLKKKVF